MVVVVVVIRGVGNVEKFEKPDGVWDFSLEFLNIRIFFGCWIKC